MAIRRSFIAEKAIPFGNHLLLKKRWQFGHVISLNIRWQFGDTHSLSFCGRFDDNPIAKHLFAILATSYCLNRNDRVSIIAFFRLEGVNYVSHMFSYFSRYFLILVFLRDRYLLILLRPFLAIRESDFSSRFLYLWHCKVVRHTCAPEFHAQHAGFLDVRCFPAFAKGFWCKRPLGERESYLSYSQKSLDRHFLA
jgi:hypothetical protein